MAGALKMAHWVVGHSRRSSSEPPTGVSIWGDATHPWRFANSALQNFKMLPQQVHSYTDKVLRKQQRLQEEEANHLQIIIHQVQSVTRDERALPSKEGGPSWGAEVWRKHAPSSGKDQNWLQSPVSGPMTKESKMSSYPAQRQHEEMGHDGGNQLLRRDQGLLRAWAGEKRNQTKQGPQQVGNDPGSITQGL